VCNTFLKRNHNVMKVWWLESNHHLEFISICRTVLVKRCDQNAMWFLGNSACHACHHTGKNHNISHNLFLTMGTRSGPNPMYMMDDLGMTLPWSHGMVTHFWCLHVPIILPTSTTWREHNFQRPSKGTDTFFQSMRTWVMSAIPR
jgi:hypothetical protein